MRNAARVLILVIGVAVVAACHKTQQNTAANQQMSIDDNLSNGAGANGSIETLPADESSTASNGELNKGEDNPDVNDVGNGD